MQSTDDSALLRQYAENNSDEAFAALVTRHVNLVYSVAMRCVGNPSSAEEITQAVFIILARKAGQLRNDNALSSWLFQATRLTANNFLRSQMRRQRREQEAHDMQMILNEPEPELWTKIAPLLDTAVANLDEKDRRAILLRFYEGKNLREIGTVLGANEVAAEKRVNRALEKLRKFFTKRGVSSTTAILAGTISANSVQAAPVALAKSVTAVAIAKGAAASGSTLTLIKGALKIMAWRKVKTTLFVSTSTLFVVGAFATGLRLFGSSDIAFEAEGTIVYETSPERGSMSETRHFVVMRQGNLWKIRTANLKEKHAGILEPENKQVESYNEMGFDGTDIYTLNAQDEQKALSGFSPRIIRSGKYVLASGRVEKADSPPYLDGKQLYPVWLAYCSAPYFKNLKDDKAVPPDFGVRDFIHEPIIRIQSPAKWNLSDGFFLKDVSWFSDGTFTATMPDGKQSVQKYQPPFDKGFTDRRFETLTWTNWNGVSIPNSFKITVYQPPYPKNADAALEVVFTITGTLEKLRNMEKLSPVPELKTKTMITDWRMEPIGDIHSYVSSNRWDFSDAIH